MTDEMNSTNLSDNRFDRRRFLTATAATAAVTATSLLHPLTAGAEAETIISLPDRVSNGNKVEIVAKPLPEKVFTTAAAGISRQTHEEHYKLYQGYVKKANEITATLAKIGTPDPAKANGTFSDIRELKVEYSFAIGGVKNHELYFNIIGGKGGAPTGDIAGLLKDAFGSFENWKADLKATGIAARGWVWLAHDYTDNSLFNYIGDTQNTYPVWNATPLLGLDVYEHAYYLDFQTARAKYIDAFFQCD